MLRPLGAAIGSSIFTAGEAWINQLAGDARRGRIIGIYAAALSAGFGTGPLVLSLTGIEGWPPFLVNAAISALATLPLLGVGEASRNFGRERGAGPLRMFARAPVILGVVAVFGLYEASLMAMLPIWGVRSGLTERWAAATLSAVYFRVDRAPGADRLAVGSRIAADRIAALRRGGCGWGGGAGR